jgi:hypothetical protein
MLGVYSMSSGVGLFIDREGSIVKIYPESIRGFRKKKPL